jgi:ribosomal protein S18 acetylase RimI-like enzyme
MVPCSVRQASILDISSIVQIRLGAVTEQEVSGFIVPGDNPYASVEQLQALWETNNLLNDGCEVFVAERRGKIVGFIVYNINSRNDNIDNLVVAKEEQRKGVGRTLVEYVERLARSRGYNVIRTDTTENAEGIPWKAYGFWRTMGYEDTGERVPTEYGFKVIPLVKTFQ